MSNPIRSLIQAVKERLSPAVTAPPADETQPAPAPEAISMAHVWVADPNALKLRITPMILPMGEKRLYSAPEETLESPLAQSIFEIGGIESVELESAAVTVHMTEDSDWDAIMQRIPEVIREHMESGLLAVDGLHPQPKAQPAGKSRYNFGFKQVSSESRPREEQLEIVRHLLDEEINPAVAAHGGYFNLIDVRDDTVYVQLGGGCQGCGMVDVTLRQGVEQRMREVLPEMVALVDVTDHASGDNPFYQPSK